MKERPILFSAPMVQAILDGRKTQTRRPIKENVDMYHIGFNRWRPTNQEPSLNGKLIACPYGQVGDKLWVRETFFEIFDDNTIKPTGKFCYEATNDDDVTLLDADGSEVLNKDGTPKSPWKSPIYMPRHASRIDLKITSIRVERIQNISADDVLAEGIFCLNQKNFRDNNWLYWSNACKNHFKNLWNSIYPSALDEAINPKCWEANPFVWVIGFEVLKKGTK